MESLPTVDILSDGEEIEFDRRDAAFLYYHEDADHEVSEDGKTVTAETKDANGNDLILTYKLNQIFIEVAEYDIPAEEVEFTTPPADTERLMVYGDERDVDDGAVVLEDTQIRNGSDDFSAVWDHADDIEAEEDYISVIGIDESQNPIPNQYEANWILVKAAYADAPDDPFFTHPKYEE